MTSNGLHFRQVLVVWLPWQSLENYELRIINCYFGILRVGVDGEAP